ncbi:unnamed protein product [Spirodela intermedia]|uniref:HTH myb-type domain-containing protein n=1 Tax=Spirodela intermedia TaxID=51605 RepID=A0A7I8KZL2_SPIIN|nr:unnamed protein product [Spirodela intermedia]
MERGHRSQRLIPLQTHLATGSADSGSSSSLNNSSIPSQERDSSAPPSKGPSFPQTSFYHQAPFQPSAPNACSKQSDELVWSADSIERFLVGDDAADGIGQMQSHAMAGSASRARQNDWSDLVSNDSLGGSWNDYVLRTDGALAESKALYPAASHLLAQMAPPPPQFYQQMPSNSGGMSAANGSLSSGSSGPPAKPRIRWTPELHERFVEAVNQLGGSEKATPKGVLKLMRVDRLTIYHVKSHLQKYRTARFKPDSPEGASERNLDSLEGMTSLDQGTGLGITEALRLQMEVQKKLHEQLEIQRKLQLQIEEQGKYLQIMFENQRRMDNGGHNPSSTLDSAASATAATNETPGQDGAAAGDTAVDPEPARESSSGAGGEQHRVNPETPPGLDSVPSEAFPSTPRGKRPRLGEVHP